MTGDGRISGCVVQIGFLLNLFFYSVCETRAETDPGRIYAALDRENIAYNCEQLARAASQAIIKAIDSKASIVSQVPKKDLEKKLSVISAHKWPEGIRYIELAGFYSDWASVTESLTDLYDKDAVGMIMDLRGAGGADIEAVDNVSGVFLQEGTELFKVTDSHDKLVELHTAAKTDTSDFEIPLIILVDENTRGASEFFTAALKGRKRCLVMGCSTQGDSAIRERISLSEKAELYIATKRVVPVSGVQFDPGGVQPDIVVSDRSGGGSGKFPSSSEKKKISKKEQLDRDLMELTKDDPLMGRAFDVLLGLRALGNQ
ncbi:MAG: S41 family peptidase [Verrucomicrobiota bacterium]